MRTGGDREPETDKPMKLMKGRDSGKGFYVIWLGLFLKPFPTLLSLTHFLLCSHVFISSLCLILTPAVVLVLTFGISLTHSSSHPSDDLSCFCFLVPIPFPQPCFYGIFPSFPSSRLWSSLSLSFIGPFIFLLAAAVSLSYRCSSRKMKKTER